MIEAMNNPPLYKKLIEAYNGKVLPNEEGLINLLKGKLYGINENSAPRAAKIFFENGKALDLIDENNRLRYLITPAGAATNGNKGSAQNGQGNGMQDYTPPPPPKKHFEQAIDLGDESATLSYPKNMTPDQFSTLSIMLQAILKTLDLRINKKQENEIKNESPDLVNQDSQ